ncbi:MAG: MOSC domain-containing protein [Gammaproteobacteria bacterium]|nr:MOSC domain-containing protein [Gammaproteobacteria bacterium]
MQAQVIAVHLSAAHTFAKRTVDSIALIAGQGVAGDAHCGRSVQHRSRIAREASAPNLRQVHLLQQELLDELGGLGFKVAPGAIGENITTTGLDLLTLASNTELHIGPTAIVRITGLRNPCKQLDAFQPGLMHAVLDRDANGELIRKSGIMGVVVQGGAIKCGDRIVVHAPEPPFLPLRPV